MSKTVEIHQIFTLHNLAQDDPEVKAWMSSFYRAIGPCWGKGAKQSTLGLTFDEERVLIPHLKGIEADDRDFRKTVITFADQLTTRIPAKGRKFEIGLQNDNEPLSKTNLPVNIEDYVEYRRAVVHPEVAKTKEQGESTFGKKFYIHDPEGVSRGAVKLNKLEDDATTLYMKYKTDEVKTDQILVMMGVRIDSLSQDEKLLKLKTFAQKDPKANGELEQAALLEKFISICTDKNLEWKYLIQEMIGAQYLKRLMNAIVYSETNEKVGENMDDAVLYFRNPKNNKEALILRAKYEALVKRGKDYLPKEDPILEDNKQTVIG